MPSDNHIQYASESEKRKSLKLKKHSLHGDGENSSLCFIEAVHQWKWATPLTLPRA